MADGCGSSKSALNVLAKNRVQGGTIRGFMNDGNTNFKTHYSVDSLAFGHCDYAYRNLGRISKLKIRQEHDVFEVIIDDRLCFSSDKVHT